MFVERMEQGGRLQLSAAACDAEFQGMSPGSNRIFIPMNDQPRADLFAESVAKFDHLFELVARVDVKKGKRQRTRIKRFAREVHEHARIFSDRIQQYRIPKLCDGFAENVNRFAFKLPKMCPILIHCFPTACLCNPHSFELDSHHQRPARMSSPG